jgi:uncharacterized phiE125 gp8 family phage protein
MSLLFSGGLGIRGSFVPYGSLNFTVTSPPQSFVEPLTLAQVQSNLKLDDEDLTDEDIQDELRGLISAAREQAEIEQNRDLVKKQYDLTLDYWPPYRIQLRAPLVSVDLVQYQDYLGVVHTSNAGTDYLVDLAKQPGCIMPPFASVWPSFTPAPGSAILIRFTSGYTLADPFWSDAGARLRVGMKKLISDWFNNRMPTGEVPEDVLSILSYGALPRVR